MPSGRTGCCGMVASSRNVPWLELDQGAHATLVRLDYDGWIGHGDWARRRSDASTRRLPPRHAQQRGSPRPGCLHHRKVESVAERELDASLVGSENQSLGLLGCDEQRDHRDPVWLTLGV